MLANVGFPKNGDFVLGIRFILTMDQKPIPSKLDLSDKSNNKIDKVHRRGIKLSIYTTLEEDKTAANLT